MKKQIIYTVFFTLFIFQVQAQYKKEALKDLFDVMQVEKTNSKMMKNVIPLALKQVQKTFKNEEDKDKYDACMKFITEETTRLTHNITTIEIPLIYEKYFTYEDIINLTKFYKTPAGQKFIEKSPLIAQETVQIMMTKYMPQFQNKIKEKLEELKK